MLLDLMPFHVMTPCPAPHGGTRLFVIAQKHQSSSERVLHYWDSFSWCPDTQIQRRRVPSPLLYGERSALLIPRFGSTILRAVELLNLFTGKASDMAWARRTRNGAPSTTFERNPPRTGCRSVTYASAGYAAGAMRGGC